MAEPITGKMHRDEAHIMDTTRKQIFQMPEPRRITKAEFEHAVWFVMARSGKSRDVAVLALGLAAVKMAEGRK